MSLYKVSLLPVTPCLFTLKLTQLFLVNQLLLVVITQNLKLNLFLIAEDVIKVADDCERRGNNVTRLCFDDSPHVNHYDQHREVYILNLDQFLKKCIEVKRGNPNENFPETDKTL
jgi:hypothetical protein